MRKIILNHVLLVSLVFATTHALAASNEMMHALKMTQAVLANKYCPNANLVGDDAYAKLANSKGLDAVSIRDIRNGMLFLASNGQIGARNKEDTMKGIGVAASLFSVDYSKLGTDAWCKFKLPDLRNEGFIAKSGN